MPRRSSLSLKNKNTCDNDPNFAEICSFIEVFGKTLGEDFRFAELQRMIEARKRVSVPRKLLNFHVKLLIKYFKHPISPAFWERFLVRFAEYMGMEKEADEVQEKGYRLTSVKTKLKILKNLLEIQFDCNRAFKVRINKFSARRIRKTPLGRDKDGQFYWCQVDSETNVRIQKEDLDKARWETVITSREELDGLIDKLKITIELTAPKLD